MTAPAATKARSGEEGGVTLNFSRASVAIIDSNSLCMELLTSTLRGFGFRNNYRCATLAQGIDVVKTHAVDLILIDPLQFGDQAYDFIKWLRAERRGRNAAATVLIVTASTSLRQITSARQCGADYVVAKPFSVSALLERIVWVANSEGKRGDLLAPADLVSQNGSGVELW